MKKHMQETQRSTQQNEQQKGTVMLTEEQARFYIRKKKIKELEEQYKGMEIPYAAARQIDHHKEQLFASVLKFALKEAKKTLVHYHVDNDAWIELQQAFAVKFYEKLNDYDPLRTTPTTYYVRYFKEVISTYLSENTLHLSQYDIKNSRKVMSAVNYFDERGIPWTEDMLANRCGLSVKVVKSTLRHRHSVNYASTEDEECAQLTSSAPGPEETILRQERCTVLNRVIASILTEEERDILARRLNFDGAKYKSFENVHLETGIPLKNVKALYNSAILKLGDNPEILKLFHMSSKTRTGIGRIRFRDNATSLVTEQLVENI